MKKILYIDLDGVVADFDGAIRKHVPDLDAHADDYRSRLVDEVCEANRNIFYDLEPIQNAIPAVKTLFDHYEVYFLSTPMWNVPESFTGKRIWIEKHFGHLATKRLILTHRKDLNHGAYLIDDRFKNGAGEFTGVHIHFGSQRFPDWMVVLNYLLP